MPHRILAWRAQPRTVSAVPRHFAAWLRVGVPALVAAALLSACSSDAPAGGPGSAQAEAPIEGAASLNPAAGADGLSSIAALLQDAYNSLPLGTQQLTYDEYQALYAPIWERAGELGYTLTRMPVQSADGFSLTESESTSPGHALLTEVTGEGLSACIAASDAVDVSLLPEEQAEEALSAKRTFLVVEGGCAAHAAYLASL